MAEVVIPDLDDNLVAVYQARADAVGVDLDVYIASVLTAIAEEADRGK